MPDLRVVPTQSEALPPLLAQIARLLAESPCQHCGQAPYSLRPVPESASPAARAPALDEVDDDERWLWRLVEDGDRVRAGAPPAPAESEVAAADTAVAEARTNAERLDVQVAMTERALTSPGTWLRPSRRAVLVKQLRRQQASAVIAAAHLSRAEQRRAALRQRAEERTAYLAGHHDTLDAAANAKAELARRVDDLIHAYGRLPEAPPWFKFGLGTPDAATYDEWLRRARAAVSHRRRYGIDHPLEPMG